MILTNLEEIVLYRKSPLVPGGQDVLFDQAAIHKV